MPRIQAGNWLDFGNVILNGMTDAELADSVGLRFDDVGKKIYYIPQDILDQAYKAYSRTYTGFTYGTHLAPRSFLCGRRGICGLMVP